MTALRALVLDALRQQGFIAPEAFVATCTDEEIAELADQFGLSAV
jgi:hypothetical protein